VSKQLAKATDAQVNQILRWILSGHTEHDIREAIAHEWPDQDATPLVLAAVRKLSEAGRPDSDVLRGWCLLAYQDIYRRALEAGDLQTSLAAVKQLRRFAEETCSD